MEKHAPIAPASALLPAAAVEPEGTRTGSSGSSGRHGSNGELVEVQRRLAAELVAVLLRVY